MSRSSIKKVRMNLGPRSYDIRIGAGAVKKLPQFLKDFSTKRAFLIFDEKLKNARELARSSLRAAGWEVNEISVVGGEGLKDIESVYPLYAELLKLKANRDSTIFALGGGSVGDAAGFVASTYLRGISWVGLPTTVLAQVDSAIGGKTGINHEAGKNLIGSFHQPSLVVNDINFLKTLNSQELTSGFGEAIKYGITFDPKFFAYLVENSKKYMKLDPGVLGHVVEKSVQWKCRVVAKDEFDRKGVREVLNFGHTFGHALESITCYEVFQHGEAVIWGMRFALALSQVRGKLTQKEYLKIDGFLQKQVLPPLPKDYGAEEIFGFMAQDKKVRDGKLHFVLLEKLGHTVSDNQVGREDLFAAFELMSKSKAAR